MRSASERGHRIRRSSVGANALRARKVLERIRAFDGERFAVETAATLQHRDRAFPILSVLSRVVAPRTLLVLASVHGDELAGNLAVPSILEAWSASSSTRVRLVVIKPVNPVGDARHSRRNAGGHDINRDVVHFVTPEARVVRDVFHDVRPDFVISLHEVPQRRAFIFTNRHVEPPLAQALCDALAAGRHSARGAYFGRRLRPAQRGNPSAVGW